MSNPYANCLYSPEQVRRMDAYAIGTLGIPGLELMERAGAAAFRALRERWPLARRLAVVCGVGNNAGDGFIVARLAREAGLTAEVLQLGDAGRLRGDARTAADAYRAAGGSCRPFAVDLLAEADLIVDAIFGTGLDRPVQAAWAEAIESINAARRPVLAVDIPSGLSGGTGAVLGAAVRAELTVTFVAHKCGLFTGAGPAQTGELRLADLDVPPEVYRQSSPAARLLDGSELANRLPGRRRDAHKGSFGHVLAVGGERGMGGAARLAAEAAARVGAGLVTVATRPEHLPVVLAGRPELMCAAVEHPADLEPLLARATVVAVGPGLGQGGWGRSLFQRVLEFGGPLVLDADALNLLAVAPRRHDRWILTPHPGEAARLLGVSPRRIQDDRFVVVDQLSLQYGGVAVLKGAGSLIQGQGDSPWLCAAGNPGMASGGMGDVLTGVIAGLLAQGLGLLDAARLGAYLHASAADAAAAAGGERGLLASDLFPYLRTLVNPR